MATPFNPEMFSIVDQHQPFIIHFLGFGEGMIERIFVENVTTGITYYWHGDVGMWDTTGEPQASNNDLIHIWPSLHNIGTASGILYYEFEYPDLIQETVGGITYAEKDVMIDETWDADAFTFDMPLQDVNLILYAGHVEL